MLPRIHSIIFFEFCERNISTIVVQQEFGILGAYERSNLFKIYLFKICLEEEKKDYLK